MDEPTPVAGDAGATPHPTPGQRMAAAADDVKHEAQDLYGQAVSSAEHVIDRLDEATTEARERAVQAGEGLVDDLRGLGSRLAAALQAAATTPEAEGLKTDIREGAQRLVNELQSAIKASPIGKMSGRPDAAAVADAASAEAQAVAAAPSDPPVQRMAATVRTEVANALRSLNRALDRLAGQLEPTAQVVDSTAAPAADAPSGDAPGA